MITRSPSVARSKKAHKKRDGTGPTAFFKVMYRFVDDNAPEPTSRRVEWVEENWFV